jgi:hypothetical protein
MSNLSSFGFTFSALNSFGFTGNIATSFFGQEAVANFVESYFNFAEGTVVSGNTANIFEQAQQYDQAVNSGNNQSAVAALQEVDADLRNSIGKGLTDISYSINGDGTITASIDGIEGATNTVNIGDLMEQGFADAGIDLSAYGLDFF